MLERLTISTMLTLTLVLGTAGCSTEMATYNINVRLAKELELKNRSGYPGVDVFFRCVTESERLRKWTTSGHVDEYTEYRGSAGDDQEHVERLGANEQAEATLSASDPFWQTLSKLEPPRHLVIIANHPKRRPDSSSRDGRWVIVPIPQVAAGSAPATLNLEVTERGLRLLSPIPKVSN